MPSKCFSSEIINRFNLDEDTSKRAKTSENKLSFYIGSDFGGSFNKIYDGLTSTRCNFFMNPEFGLISKDGYIGTVVFGYQRERWNFTVQDYLWNNFNFGVKLGKEIKIKNLKSLSRIGANQIFQSYDIYSNGLSDRIKSTWKSANIQLGFIWKTPFIIEIIPLLNIDYQFDIKLEDGTVLSNNLIFFFTLNLRYIL